MQLQLRKNRIQQYSTSIQQYSVFIQYSSAKSSVPIWRVNFGLGKSANPKPNPPTKMQHIPLSACKTILILTFSCWVGWLLAGLVWCHATFDKKLQCSNLYIISDRPFPTFMCLSFINGCLKIFYIFECCTLSLGIEIRQPVSHIHSHKVKKRHTQDNKIQSTNSEVQSHCMPLY